MSEPAVLPLTFGECRARFRGAAVRAGATVEEHRIAAPGPYGEALSVDHVVLGDPSADRVLIVMSGVHGVEGFVGSAMQCDLLAAAAARVVPGVRIDLIHGVNPWGMAWWRRANESNVDLNRNWDRDRGVPFHNDPYEDVHALVAPGAEDLTDDEDVVRDALALAETRGLPWLRDAITRGQYRHRDGLHFGGDRTEASTAIVERIARGALEGAAESFCLDLHTGHGEYGAMTLLSDQPLGSEDDEWLRDCFGSAAVEATAGNPDATTGVKTATLAQGMGALGPGRHRSATLEIGTVDDATMLLASRRENWHHHHDPTASDAKAAARWAMRNCYTIDDPAWVRAATDAGGRVIDQAIAAMAEREP